MTEIGSVIDGKYEVLKEIGHGGMSTVYLAMDKRLNKQWAIKEIRKQGSSGKDEIIVNSLLAEANMMKRLDHPALPRIVDIIDNGVTIYIIMDYIEGESLDKILLAEGVQSEEKVIGWAKQLCDALGYLHSQKPPIIYRDMKPANVMLKPEGNIKIIDFGIAREYKEAKLSDTTVLGTKGYAPPEQYGGQTDPRSDIFALGMTMHNLLTGVDPRKGKAYRSAGEYNSKISEGIDLIIDKCVEPVAEKRYQNCNELLYDLEHPDLITSGYKRKQKRKLALFITTAVLTLAFAAAGFTANRMALKMNNSDYDLLVGSNNVQDYYDAIDIYPDKVFSEDENAASENKDGYNQLIEYYKNHGCTADDIKKLGNTVDRYASVLDINDPNVAELYYNIGKLYFSELDESLKGRAAYAKDYFEAASTTEADFDKKDIAGCYYSICRFMTNQSTTSEHSLDDFDNLFAEIRNALAIVDASSDSEANYDKISLYYVTMMFINDQAPYMASVGVSKTEVLNLMEEINRDAGNIVSTLAYVNELQEKIDKSYKTYVSTVNASYTEVEKRQNGGN